jgi:hypothetical protein
MELKTLKRENLIEMYYSWNHIEYLLVVYKMAS